MYFYDWTRIANPGSRFENYVACELKAITELWTDAGVKETILQLRKNMPENMPLLIKLNTFDHTPRPGITPEMAVK